MKKILIMIVIFAGFWSEGFAYDSKTPEKVLIVVNSNSTASSDVGRYYQSKRGVPETNFLQITCTTTETCTAVEYETNIRDQVKNYLETSGLKSKILYIVMCYGIPVKFDSLVTSGYSYPGDTYRSVDSFLTDPFTARPVYRSIGRTNPCRNMDIVRTDNTFNNNGAPYYFVTRIDGPTSDIAKGLVDKAMLAEKSLIPPPPTYTGYVDGNNTIQAEDGGGYNSTNNAILRCYDEMQAAGWNSVKDTHPERFGNATTGVTHCKKAIWYSGWYVGTYEDVFDWQTGAIGFHLYSWTAASIRTGNSWVTGMLNHGITGTAGTVAEPFTWGYMMFDVFYNRFLSTTKKFNFADACYASTAMNPSYSSDWMMTFVGDPLYTIYAGGASKSGSKDINPFDIVVPYPNPYTPLSGVNGTFKVRNLPGNSVFSIFDISGQLLRTLKEEDFGNIGFINWDGRDSDGNYLPNGIYLYTLTDVVGHKKAGKIAYKK